MGYGTVGWLTWLFEDFGEVLAYLVPPAGGVIGASLGPRGVPLASFGGTCSMGQRSKPSCGATAHGFGYSLHRGKFNVGNTGCWDAMYGCSFLRWENNGVSVKINLGVVLREPLHAEDQVVRQGR